MSSFTNYKPNITQSDAIPVCSWKFVKGFGMSSNLSSEIPSGCTKWPLSSFQINFLEKLRQMLQQRFDLCFFVCVFLALGLNCLRWWWWWWWNDWTIFEHLNTIHIFFSLSKRMPARKTRALSPFSVIYCFIKVWFVEMITTKIGLCTKPQFDLKFQT